MKAKTSNEPYQKKALLVMRYYWSVVRNYPHYLLGTLLTVPFTVVINGFIPPLIIAHIIKQLSTTKTEPSQLWSHYGLWILLYVAVQFIGILTWRLVDYFMWRLEIRAQQRLAEDVFNHLLKHSANFHANHFGGSLVSQANKLLTSYVRVFDTTTFQLLPMIVSIIATIVILLPRAPYFVLGLLLLTLIFIGVALKLSVRIRAIATSWSARESRQTGLLADAITNILTIKSYSRGQHEKKRFHRATESTRAEAFRFSRLHQVQMNAFGFIIRSIASGALVLALYSVIVLKQDVGLVFLMISYTATITEHLFRFGNDSMRAYNRAFGDAYSMARILSQEPEVVDVDKPEPLRISQGDITFDNVVFTHSESQDALFQGLNLHIKAGEKVGLVGHSGAGKTTFTQLLMRFSDIDSGSIRIDGQNIAAITQDDLHDQIAYVPQEPMLFHRSLAENIGYGKSDASADDIKHAAIMANAEEFISELSDGYDTLVGERGIKLSGGQRQRVAIARAMLKNAPILILDEATSALDSESEVLIQKALWKLMEGRTAIVIAHRLSTIQKMDRIIVMDGGKIVEEGTHKDLLAKNGIYARLWAHQSGGFIDD